MELDLSDSNLTQFQDLSPVAWRKINLNHNFLFHIFWDNLPISVEYISAARNEVRHIDIDMPFPFLQTLLLSKNHIRSFRIDVILSSLQTLDLSQNWIESLQFLDHMPALKHLTLSHNEVELLQNLPQSLETLNASHCRIKLVQTRLPPNLKELNLAHNNLKQGGLPLCWGSLQSLTLSFNQLKSFPKRLPDTVTHINLAMNEIEDIPSKLPASLHTLLLNHNRIRHVPWKTNVHLHILKIDFNRIIQDFTNGTLPWVTHFLVNNNWNDPEHNQTQRIVKRCWKRYLLKKRLRHIYRSRVIYDELLMVALHPDHVLQTDVFSPEWFSKKPQTLSL